MDDSCKRHTKVMKQVVKTVVSNLAVIYSTRVSLLEESLGALRFVCCSNPESMPALTTTPTTQVLYPKECVALYPNEIVGERVSKYAEVHSSCIPKHIINYHAHVSKTLPETAKYMISISQAQMMVFLSKTVGAKRSKCPPFFPHRFLVKV